jgi:hypothetical protein
LFLNHPVEDKIVFVAHSVKQILEQLPQVANVGLLFELKRPAVVQVDRELLGVPLGQSFDRGGKLLVSDLFVFLLLGLGWEALPRKTASVEVHKYKTQRFEVVSSRLL